MKFKGITTCYKEESDNLKDLDISKEVEEIVEMSKITFYEKLKKSN